VSCVIWTRDKVSNFGTTVTIHESENHQNEQFRRNKVDASFLNKAGIISTIFKIHISHNMQLSSNANARPTG